MKRERERSIRHEINFEVDAELDEELIHLTQISCVPMRVEEGWSGHGVSYVDGNDLRPSTGRKLQHFHIFPVWEVAQCIETRQLVCHYLVGRRIWWEKGKFCSHGWSNPSHLSLSHSSPWRRRRRRRLEHCWVILGGFYFMLLGGFCSSSDDWLWTEERKKEKGRWEGCGFAFFPLSCLYLSFCFLVGRSQEDWMQEMKLFEFYLT